MRTKKKLIAILLIAAILSSFIPNLISYAAEPSYTMNIAGTTETSQEEAVGETVSVDVNFANGVENQKSLALAIGFDSTALELQADYVDPIDGPQLLSGMSLNGEIAPAATVVMGTADSEGAYLAFNSRLGIATSGRVATLKFKVLKGGSSDVIFKSIIYDDGTGVETEVTSTSKVTITGRIPLSGLTVEPNTVTVNKGNTKTLTATKNPTDTTDTTPITWKSSNEAVATVDSNGKVIAVGVGTATITATCKNYSDTSTVTVDNPLKGLKLDKTAETVARGGVVQLTATKNPTDTTDTNPITWKSSNEAVATVDSNGKVTAVGIGNAAITATCGTHTTEPFNITVNAPLVGITMNKKEAGIDKAETVQLSVTKKPVDTTDSENVVWTSSNSDIASVDNNGLVTGKALGKTTITATIETSHGTYTATCEVTVNVHIESITIVNAGIDASRNLELYKNQTADLTVDFNPDEFAESKTIIWESSDKTVAKVENGKVTAVAPGTTTITATTVNGKTDSITVTVPIVKAATLTINKNNTSIEKGNSEQLTTEILPENTTDDTTVTWESSDENVVTVVDGLVTAVGVGNATVTAKAAGLDATCNVVVTCALESIALDKDELKLEAGTTSDALVVTKNPTDATVDLANVNWTSKNPEVATVVNGKVTAVAPGTAIIEAELDGKKATCEVTVIVTLTGVEIENGNTALELIKGQTSDLKVVYTPANSTEIPDATWSSSDEEVATVENGKVTALKEGTTMISVDYGNGIVARRKVVVKEIHADSVVFNKVVESLNKKETVDLDVNILPENTTDDKTITWESSDETVAKVDKDGKVAGLKAGKTTIKATTVNGKFAEMEIEVKEVALESITVTADKKVEEGKQTQVKVELNPENTTDDLVYTYKSSNESIATVDKNGKVTAKKAGKVVITVSVEATNGEGQTNTVTSQVSLTVTEKPTTSAPGGSAPAPAAPATSPVAALTTSPHTGDMNVVALAVMMVISLAGMIITIKKK